MQKAYVLSGEFEGKEIHGIFFNSASPNLALLNCLGIKDISFSEGNPLSQQPVEPALYLFRKNSNEVDIIGFNWSLEQINRQKVCGFPHLLIPPVGGKAAEETLYAPIAYLIKGTVGRGTPVLGILIIKPEAGEQSLDPTSKMLKKIGMHQISTFEKITCGEKNVVANQLYLVERSPSADEVTVKTLSNNGDIIAEKTLKGDPEQLLPCVKGHEIEKLFRNGLTPTVPPAKSTFPPHSGRPPSSKRKRRC
ncbi:hypothetical protein JXA56_05220 [Candidatus Micrarchaeota archaeon]|nr:hypothetical protein [Candidatus Micrarchaeota archaeon]